MTTPAGWYPDTQRPATQRYWDGEAWSEHRAPLEQQAQSRHPLMWVFVVAAGILLAAGVFVVVAWMAGSDDGLVCATENAERAQRGEPALVCPE